MNSNFKIVLMSACIVAFHSISFGMQPEDVLGGVGIAGDLNVCGYIAQEPKSPHSLQEQCINTLAKKIIAGQITRENAKQPSRQSATAQHRP